MRAHLFAYAPPVEFSRLACCAVLLVAAAAAAVVVVVVVVVVGDERALGGRELASERETNGQQCRGNLKSDK